jgi:hypothetical protein
MVLCDYIPIDLLTGPRDRPPAMAWVFGDSRSTMTAVRIQMMPAVRLFYRHDLAPYAF